MRHPWLGSGHPPRQSRGRPPERITGPAEPPGPPAINAVPGQNVFFRITIVENILGDLQGKLTERFTQIHPADNERTMPIATLWKIETADSTPEGHYSGIYKMYPDGRTAILQSGEILLVTRAYAHLYRAEVFYGAKLNADKTAVDGWISIRKR